MEAVASPQLLLERLGQCKKQPNTDAMGAMQQHDNASVCPHARCVWHSAFLFVRRDAACDASRVNVAQPS